VLNHYRGGSPEQRKLECCGAVDPANTRFDLNSGHIAPNGPCCHSLIMDDVFCSSMHNRLIIQQNCSKVGKDHQGCISLLRRSTSKKRMAAKLKGVKTSLMARRDWPVDMPRRWLGAVVREHLEYYAVPGDIQQVTVFRDEIIRLCEAGCGDAARKHG
jgi:hypothetical protein